MSSIPAGQRQNEQVTDVRDTVYGSDGWGSGPSKFDAGGQATLGKHCPADAKAMTDGPQGYLQRMTTTSHDRKGRDFSGPRVTDEYLAAVT